MIEELFPYRLHLHILQLEEYHVGKLFQWVFHYFFKRKLENKKPLIWTQKARVIFLLSLVLSLLILMFLTIQFALLGFVIGVLLATQSYISLTIAVTILKPYESFRKEQTKRFVKDRLASFSKLTVIGITGSYGKTSVKEFLYTILKQQYQVLKTPESYNTVLGIAKVVDLELDNTYQYFIVEMGAYKRGEIKEIADMASPKHGILTGITEQHVETFGSLEQIIQEKFELIDSLPNDGYAVVNTDNLQIKKHLRNYKRAFVSYGFNNDVFSIKNISIDNNVTKFELILNKIPYNATTRLVGNSNLQNILGAATMAFLVGMKPQGIVAAILTINPVSHRLEIKEIHDNLTVIDDAYNSNIEGFREALHLLQEFEKRPKILATPGIVQLGSRTQSIHYELGKLVDDVCDYVYLIGKSERTESLARGIENRQKIVFLDSISQLWKHIEDLKLEKPIVLVENDLPDNY